LPGVVTRGDDVAGGEDDLGGEEVVDRQPILALQPGEAAAERKARDPGGRDDAARGGEPEGGVRSLARAVRDADSAAGSLEVGIGVASGEEFVGNVGGGGYKDFTAVGAVTNTAARLTSVARDGEIIIDAPTYEAVARAYPDAQRQRLALKGQREPADVFRIPP
jgi:class 3 adenylate cyclase